MIILNEADIDALLPMADAIEVVDAAMRQVSDGATELPLRFTVPVGDGNRMGVMPGAMAGDGVYGVKLISLFPGNPARGLSSHRGALALFENDTGGLIGLVEASRLTAIRTAAASAVATRALARTDAQRLAIIGTGEQAYAHLDAICAVRPITELAVAGRDRAKARALADHADTRHPGLQVTAGTDIRAAMRGADIICTVTAAREPIVSGDWLEPGQHLNAVGASIPTMREVDDRVVARAEIWTDYRPSALAQAGEIIAAVEAGRLAPEDLTEIGAVLTGQAPGRTDAAQITLYRSLGVAAQDLACARYALERARENSVGQTADFG
ncbi:MAG TPA: ornithine cyclodeaminase family protein [Aliiroseovarius sp.]|nr:ornithine cyclodeaminase family protein [Aliiroseovarius sp.]